MAYLIGASVLLAFCQLPAHESTKIIGHQSGFFFPWLLIEIYGMLLFTVILNILQTIGNRIPLSKHSAER